MAYNRGMPHRPETDSSDAVRVVFLGSGSSGNSAAVTDGTTTVLVDCGFSARETTRRLRGHGIPAESVSAILVTHEHTDHTSGVAVFARRYGATVWATAGTRRGGRFHAHTPDVRTLAAGEPVRVGTLSVLPFSISHDAEEPVGYRIEASCGTRIGIATDTGAFTAEAAEALRGCDIVGLECNHDVDMLAGGPYPWFLKQRISSTRGHLSNPDAADALERIASDRLREVCALHLSRTNNTHDLAREALGLRLERLGLDVAVTSVTQDGVATQGSPRPL
jgi:phosphoribosyl 1,2-cyclic phosphodiesterase